MSSSVLVKLSVMLYATLNCVQRIEKFTRKIITNIILRTHFTRVCWFYVNVRCFVFVVLLLPSLFLTVLLNNESVPEMKPVHDGCSNRVLLMCINAFSHPSLIATDSTVAFQYTTTIIAYCYALIVCILLIPTYKMRLTTIDW